MKKRSLIKTILISAGLVVISLSAILIFTNLPQQAAIQEDNKRESIEGATIHNYPTITSKYQRVINLSNPLGPDFVPDDLVTIKGTDMKLDREAAAALEQMMAAMRKDGLSITVASAYRSYKQQTSTFNTKVRQMKNNYPGISDAEAKEKARHIVAIPGTSEHQSGLAVDLSQSDYVLNQNFAKTKQGKWLYEHCSEYGFILRYPSDKTEVTQIVYEPWHFRYVGIETAKEITASGLTMEEYYGLFVDLNDIKY